MATIILVGSGDLTQETINTEGVTYINEVPESSPTVENFIACQVFLSTPSMPRLRNLNLMREADELHEHYRKQWLLYLDSVERRQNYLINLYSKRKFIPRFIPPTKFTRRCSRHIHNCRRAWRKKL